MPKTLLRASNQEIADFFGRFPSSLYIQRIYPREPRNKKKANKGSTAPVTFYYSKDIQYLLHEPVLDKFRQHKTFAKNYKKLWEEEKLAMPINWINTDQKYTLNHIIKERYPTFADALRDLMIR